MGRLSSTTLLALAGAATAQEILPRGFPNCTGPLAGNDVCNTSLDPLRRATALIKLFTLQEKLNNTGSDSPGVPRLGLPRYQWWQEALHGVAESPGVDFADSGDFSAATSFPQPILMGAAFNDELIREVATVISTEARAFNNAGRTGLDFWTPNINPFRDPRWGRGQETPGEDPYHLSSYVHALIDGLQGGYDPKYKRVVATCKHFAGYDMENWNGNFRYQFDAQISQQDLVDYYLPPFQSCARDSNVGAFMCTYSALNGVPTCADPWLLDSVLRKHWGWTKEQQWVTSDCDSLQNIYLPHNYSSTREAAAAAALLAGTDVDCGTYFQEYLPGAYAQGLFNESVLDQALIRQYSSLIRLGYFDGDKVPYRALTYADVNTQKSQKLAYQAAVEGITLLKNDGTLPLQLGQGKTIAMIGGWANATTQMQGNYQGVAPYLHSPLYAATQTGANVIYSRGVGGQGDPTTNNWLPVWDAAKKADIIIYADGIDNSVELEDHDRYSVAWTGAQIDQITRLAQFGKPLIVLQMGAGQLDDSILLANPNVSAIVWGGYPGQDGGVALFDILQGKVAPAGRLPVTQYPARYIAQLPMTDMSLRPNKTSGYPGRTYIWYDEAPVLPFGYGLHYTKFKASIQNSPRDSFAISNLLSNCKEQYQDRCPFQNVTVSIQNTGRVTSDYVTLGFLSGQHGEKPYPNKRLVQYTRLSNVAAGASKEATLPLTLGSLARADQHGNKVLYPGTYTLEIDNEPLTTYRFTLTGKATTLDEWPQPPERTQTVGGGDYFVGGYGSYYTGQQPLFV